jgi:hypothetical protein
MSSREEGCVFSFEVDVDGPGESIDVFGGFTLTVGSFCGHNRRGRSICNVRPHKFFIMKNIPVESVNYKKLETCFDIPRRSCEMQRRIDNTRNVTYCHFMARMVSYPGITHTVHVRLKWPVDRYVQGLEFMTAVWTKRENSHSILFAVL